MPHRLLSHPAFWLGCFAVLMMHLGPLISGAQGVMQPAKPFQQGVVSLVPHPHGEMDMAGRVHADHHEMMGHKTNPHLPDWVNNLKMCGYCELLTLSPALMLALLVVLLAPPLLPAARPYRVTVHFTVLRSHAAPRAPPCLA
ncbi:MAG: DUF2946 domain-containing protein [Thiopseudomonas sp.]